VGKWHLGMPSGDGQNLQPYGFDESYWIDCGDGQRSLWKTEERPVASRVLIEKTMEVLQNQKGGVQPFFCQLWLNDPHAALAPSVEQMQPYRGRYVPKGFTSPREVYAGTVAEMDHQILKLLIKLDELGLTENTIVIFSSDNGPEDIEIGNASWSGLGSAGPLRGRKRSLYEGGVRVPFIVRWPGGGTPAGQLNEKTIVSGADMLPTLCELAGAPVPESLQKTIRGQSVAAAFKGDKEFMRGKPLMWEWRYKVFNHRWNCSPVLSIRDGKWKLLFNPDDSRIELYDMEADPFEESNQAFQNSEVVERLKKLALEWQASLPESPFDKEAGIQPARWPKEYDPHVEYLDRNVIFNRSDTDNDGRMSREEYLRNFGPPGAEKRKEGEERFPTFDKNQDGWLNRQEFYRMGQ
jgi:N-acetylgalactosamine-6-sulfatase